MGFEPFPDGTTGVAGQVVGNQIQVPGRIGAVQRLEQVEVASGVAGASGLGQCPAISDREGSIHPDLGWSPVVVQWHFDPVPVG